MELQRINSALNDLFIAEGHRIIFWHDPEREFEDTLTALDLSNASLLRLDEHSALEIKVRLEQEDPTSRYLLYAPFEPPEPDKDWLLDIRLYSASFSADRASMLLADLGLTQQSLRQYLAERVKFFANRDRLQRLKRLISPSDGALDIDRKIVAVLAETVKLEHHLGSLASDDLAEVKTFLLAKKRYLLGRDLSENDKAYHGSTAVTASAGGGMEFWMPKGANRFHFVGGSRFVHGGAMPQEIVVPVIRVHHVKESGKAAKTKTRTVGVSVLGSNFKVTTNRHRFPLIQTEPVGERVKPVTLKIGIYDGEDPVTNAETVTFDSTSSDMNQWKKSVSLTLEGRHFDSKGVFQLILRDTETSVEEARFDVTIDLAFINDF